MPRAGGRSVEASKVMAVPGLGRETTLPQACADANPSADAPRAATKRFRLSSFALAAPAIVGTITLARRAMDRALPCRVLSAELEKRSSSVDLSNTASAPASPTRRRMSGVAKFVNTTIRWCAARARPARSTSKPLPSRRNRSTTARRQRSARLDGGDPSAAVSATARVDVDVDNFGEGWIRLSRIVALSRSGSGREASRTPAGDHSARDGRTDRYTARSASIM